MVQAAYMNDDAEEPDAVGATGMWITPEPHRTREEARAEAIKAAAEKEAELRKRFGPTDPPEDAG